VKKLLILFSALLLIFFLGEAALYLAGLFPQDSVVDSIQSSLQQLEAEYETPYVLHNRSRNGIDNFTDCLMLNLSLCLDTRSDPLGILSNPLYWTEELMPFEELSIAAAGQSANGNYRNYCMGFRIWMKPLLTVFNYMEIRSMLSFTVWVLFGFSLLTVYRVTRNRLFAAFYALCIVSLNPVAISSSVTFMDCFIFAFLGVLLVPKTISCKQYHSFWEALLFLCLGAFTQFFDFYTYPLITFAFPMIILLAGKQSGASSLRFRDSVRILVRGLSAWLFAYVGIWALKLFVTDLFTNSDVMSSVSNTLGNSLGTSLQASDFIATIRACAENILTPEVMVALLMVFVIWMIRFCRNQDRAARLSESWIFLLIGGLSIVWIAFAKRIYEHRFFQYRTLGILLMGILAFAAHSSQKKPACQSPDYSGGNDMQANQSAEDFNG